MKSRRAWVGLLAAQLLLTPLAFAGWPPADGFVVVSNRAGPVVLDARAGEVLRAFPSRLPVTERLLPEPASEVLEPAYGTIVSADNRRLIYAANRTSHPPRRHRPDDKRFQGVYVWDMDTRKLQWSLPNSEAVALLGAKGDHLAVLTRRRFAQSAEFAVWDMDSNRRIFAQTLPVAKEATPHPLGSGRFGAFSVDRREVWIWDHQQRLLRSLPLPNGFKIWPFGIADLAEHDPPMRLAPDGRTLAIATGHSIWSVDLAAWTPPRRYVYDGADYYLEVLGWSGDGKYLLATENHIRFLQFDAARGVLLHRWEHKSPYKVWTTSREVFGRTRTKLHESGGQLQQGHAAVSPDGRVLAFWDPSRDGVALWNVSVSPPTPINRPCSGTECQANAPTGHLTFTHGGSGIAVLSANRLRHFERASGKGRLLPAITTATIIEEVRRSTPEYGVEQCRLDYIACADAGEEAYRLGQAERARLLLESACFAGRSQVCGLLEKIAIARKDALTALLANTARCSGLGAQDAACRNPGDRPSANVRELVAGCRRQAETCWAASLALGRHPAQRKTALELGQHGCREGHRPACMAGAEAARQADSGGDAYELYELACRLEPGEDCREGVRAASQGLARPAWARPDGTRPALAAPGFCEQLRSGNLTGEPYFLDGNYAGIRVTGVIPDSVEAWPFRDGDILFDDGHCEPHGCTDQQFQEWLAKLCDTDRRRLLRNVRLNVGSAVAERNRSLVIREAER